MELRDWVQDQFGATDETLLDDSKYPDEELREDKRRVNRRMQKTKRKFKKAKAEYRDNLVKASEVPKGEDREYKTKAKFAKKRYVGGKKRYQQQSIKYGTILSIEETRKILNEHGVQDPLHIDRHIDDADALEMEAEIEDKMIERGMRTEMWSTIKGSLDFEIFERTEEFDVGDDELDETVRKLREGKMSEQEIKIEEEETEEFDDMSFGDEFDDEFEDEFGEFDDFDSGI